MSNRTCSCLVLASLLAGCAGDRSGGRIVFQSNRDGNFEIYVMDANGGNQRRVTNSLSNDITPSWSPDGSLIVFATDRDGNWEIYTVRPDGSQPTRLTTPVGANTAPSWTPDGSKILFVSTRDAVNGELYLMNPDGSNVERVTNDPSVKDTPVMTPDGKNILFTMNDKGRLAIAAYNTTERAVHVLTPENCNAMNPSLGPDGQVVFSSDRDGNLNLYSMTINGENTTRLTTSQDAARTPVWAHGGESIVYAKNGGLYLLTVENHAEAPLSNHGDIFPHWTQY